MDQQALPDATAKPGFTGGAAPLRWGVGSSHPGGSRMDDLAGMTTGQRVRHFRERAGMTRLVLGGLVGRSDEWVKAVETDRLLTPRIPLLLRLAEVLQVDDLAQLTGEEKLATAAFAKSAHEALPQVARALATYPVLTRGMTPVSATVLAGRVIQLWELWHGTKRQRTAIASFLPDLLRDAQIATRLLDGADRRAAQRSLAQTYHLTQLFLCFQPVPELIWATGDRAIIAAQEADDPCAIAVAAWYLNHIFRSAGQQYEARVQLVTDTARLLRPDEVTEDRALWGLLQLAAALSYGKIGQEGSAWHHWDAAHRAARTLPDDYVHPYLIFGTGMVDAYAVTLHADLMHGREAIRTADRLDLSAMPSATRRSVHSIETARAYYLQREPIATVHLLRKAYDESPDTARFNVFARSTVTELRHRGGNTIRADVDDLARKLDLVS
jgi:transcriptional regulator with XRE-family HTH domain